MNKTVLATGRVRAETPSTLITLTWFCSDALLSTAILLLTALVLAAQHYHSTTPGSLNSPSQSQHGVR